MTKPILVPLGASLLLVVVVATWLQAGNTQGDETSESQAEGKNGDDASKDRAGGEVFIDKNTNVSSVTTIEPRRRPLTAQEALKANKKTYEGVAVQVTEEFKKNHAKLYYRLRAVKSAPKARTDYFEKNLPGPNVVSVNGWNVVPLGEPEVNVNGNTRVTVRVRPVVTGVHPATFLQMHYDEVWELRGGELHFVSGSSDGVVVLYGG